MIYKGIDKWNGPPLEHHGVKGQKWGVRKDRVSLGSGISGREIKRSAKQLKSSGMKALKAVSDIDRYTRLYKKSVKLGAAVVASPQMREYSAMAIAGLSAHPAIGIGVAAIAGSAFIGYGVYSMMKHDDMQDSNNLEHANGHKYIAKEKTAHGYRYFYSTEEYRAYLENKAAVSSGQNGHKVEYGHENSGKTIYIKNNKNGVPYNDPYGDNVHRNKPNYVPSNQIGPKKEISTGLRIDYSAKEKEGYTAYEKPAKLTKKDKDPRWVINSSYKPEASDEEKKYQQALNNAVKSKSVKTGSKWTNGFLSKKKLISAKRYKSYAAQDDMHDEYLAHYGVKGMKWGVRKIRETISKMRKRRAERRALRDERREQLRVQRNAEAIASGDSRKIISRMSKMTNEEVQSAINRLNMQEKVYQLDERLNTYKAQEQSNSFFGRLMNNRQQNNQNQNFNNNQEKGVIGKAIDKQIESVVNNAADAAVTSVITGNNFSETFKKKYGYKTSAEKIEEARKKRSDRYKMELENARNQVNTLAIKNEFYNATPEAKRKRIKTGKQLYNSDMERLMSNVDASDLKRINFKAGQSKK